MACLFLILRKADRFAMDSKKEYDMGGFDKKIGSSQEYFLFIIIGYDTDEVVYNILICNVNDVTIVSEVV